MPVHARLLFPLALLLLSGPAYTSEGITLDEVLERHFEAMGGRARIDALRNVKLRLRIEEPEFVVEGLYRASTDGRMRIDIFADDVRVFSEGVDAEGGWQQNGQGTEITGISEEGLRALQRGIGRNLTGLLALSSTASNTRLLGRQRLAGVDYFVIEAAESDGGLRQLFIHPESWLVERSRESKALHPDISATEIATEERQTEFRPLCGVLRSYKSEGLDLASGALIQTTEIVEGSCNLDDPALELSRPSD